MFTSARGDTDGGLIICHIITASYTAAGGMIIISEKRLLHQFPQFAPSGDNWVTNAAAPTRVHARDKRATVRSWTQARSSPCTERAQWPR